MFKMFSLFRKPSNNVAPSCISNDVNCSVQINKYLNASQIKNSTMYIDNNELVLQYKNKKMLKFRITRIGNGANGSIYQINGLPYTVIKTNASRDKPILDKLSNYKIHINSPHFLLWQHKHKYDNIQE